MTEASYAGFWRRGGASVLDALIITASGLPVVIVTVAAADPTDPAEFDALSGWFQLLWAVATWLYFAMMESSEWRATLGKRALGLRVTDLDGRRITFGRSTGRYFGKLLSGFIVIGYIMAAFTARKQAFHDLLARTLVLRVDEPRAEPPPPPQLQ